MPAHGGADEVELKARVRAAEEIHRRFRRILEDVMEGRPPSMKIKKRTLTNTRYDPEKGILVMGEEALERRMLDLGEVRRFMQTLLMASIIYQALVENEYPTIRDLYYRGKHTIVYRDLRGRRREVNTWDEQAESDAAIRDVEVYTGLLREEMLILSKEKGKVVGRMVIRSGGDVIDLSRLGHGAYAIESTPDLIEFRDVDAEYVLVVEKDAVFQQLHRVKFWDKHKAILVTGAGQPDRATRRFVRRLNEELKLPVYILTDSIPADEVVVVKDLEDGTVTVGPVEELVGRYFTEGAERERVTAPLAVPTWNPGSGRIEWAPVGYLYRHRIRGKIMRLSVEGRGDVRVTKAHSLFVYRDGQIVAEPAHLIRPGDYILVAERLSPLGENGGTYQTINVAKVLAGLQGSYTRRFNLKSTLWLGLGDGVEVRLRDAGPEDLERAVYLRLSGLDNRTPNKIVVDEDVAWLFGVYTAEGSAFGGEYLAFDLGPHDGEKAERLARIIEERFGVRPMVDRIRSVRVIAASRILYLLFEALGLNGTARTKKVPSVIFNSPRSVVLSYLKGLIEGNGGIDGYGDIIYSTRSPVLSKQVFLLLQALGVNPSIVVSGEEIYVRVGKSPSRTPQEVYEYLTGMEASPPARPAAEPAYAVPVDATLKGQVARLADAGLASHSPAPPATSKAKLALLYSRGLIELPRGLDVIAGGDVVLARVVAVDEEDYEGYVYDFAVPGTNSFVGGYGVVYHNSDPYGFYIYSVYKVGSIQLSYESERLATPKAMFLGVSMTDIFGDPGRGKSPYLTERERRNFIIKAKDADLKRARELMAYPWFQTPRWRKELRIFMEKRAKLEIEAMASKGLRFLADKYIPEKIETGDVIV